MKYAVMVVALALAGCADGPATKAHTAYQACLAEKGADRCQTEKAQFEAAIEYANAVSRRAASSPPLVFNAYTPPPQQPIYQPRPMLNCTTIADSTVCN